MSKRVDTNTAGVDVLSWRDADTYAEQALADLHMAIHRLEDELDQCRRIETAARAVQGQGYWTVENGLPIRPDYETEWYCIPAHLYRALVAALRDPEPGSEAQP